MRSQFPFDIPVPFDHSDPYDRYTSIAYYYFYFIKWYGIVPQYALECSGNAKLGASVLLFVNVGTDIYGDFRRTTVFYLGLLMVNYL